MLLSWWNTKIEVESGRFKMIGYNKKSNYTVAVIERSPMVKVVRRGYEPEDERAFTGEQLMLLSKAADEMRYLLNRGYQTKQASIFIGNHYMFSERQRLALARTISSDESIELRRKKLITDCMEIPEVHIDGFNLIITLEVALSGSPVFESMDGTIRDLAGLRGTYRIIDKTEAAIDLVMLWLEQYSIHKATFYLDAPVSNSKRLASLLREIAKNHQVKVEVEVIPHVDVVLETLNHVITSDGIILNKCKSWINMNHEIILKQVPNLWKVGFVALP